MKSLVNSIISMSRPSSGEVVNVQQQNESQKQQVDNQMENLSNDELMTIATFVSYENLIQVLLVNTTWKYAIDNEAFYETITKQHQYYHHHSVQDTNNCNLKTCDTWKQTFLELISHQFDSSRKHDSIEISNKGRRAKNKAQHFAKLALKNKVPKGTTLSVSVRLSTVGAGYTLLGGISSDLLPKDDGTIMNNTFGNWNQTTHYMGYYSDDRSLRHFSCGYCDNGYVCRQQVGGFKDRFEVNDIMSMEINLTEPIPTSITSNNEFRTVINDTYWVHGTENGTGFVRYFKNGKQIGPTMCNIYIEDKKNPYDLYVVMNLTPDITVDLVDVSLGRAAPFNDQSKQMKGYERLDNK
jgi:hypothetical protein